MYGIPGDFSNIFGDFLAIYLKTSEIKRKQMRSVFYLYLFRFQGFTNDLMLFFKQLTDEASFHNIFSQPNHKQKWEVFDNQRLPTFVLCILG